ncbi:hypothetical protein LCGC14_2661470, partial [marine sediment metagenome]
RLEMWAESYLVQRNKELRTCVEQAQTENERLREALEHIKAYPCPVCMGEQAFALCPLLGEEK